MFSQISAEVAHERELEVRRQSRDGRRAARRSLRAAHDASLADVTIRAASPADRGALERLAALDSASAPRGYVLVAEVHGELRAALAVAGGPAIADPFVPTAQLVDLLAVRARQLRASEVEPARARSARRAVAVAGR